MHLDRYTAPLFVVAPAVDRVGVGTALSIAGFFLIHSLSTLTRARARARAQPLSYW